MTFFVATTALLIILANVCYLRETTRAGSRSLAELLVLVAFYAGLNWIVVAQMSTRPGA